MQMEYQIGNIISQYRQNQKMTQEEFAARLGVTPQAVSKWERGNGLPDITLVGDICRLLHISADLLLGIQEKPIVENNNAVFSKEIRNNLIADPLALEFGIDITPCVIEGMKTDYINQKRNQLAKEAGMLTPLLRIMDNTELGVKEYCILSYGKVLRQGEETVDENNKMECFERIITQVFEQCKIHYHEILNKEIVKILVDNIKEQYSGIADGLVPERISYLTLEKHLKKIVQEQGSIRDFIHILEELEEAL